MRRPTQRETLTTRVDLATFNLAHAVAARRDTNVSAMLRDKVREIITEEFGDRAVAMRNDD